MPKICARNAEQSIEKLEGWLAINNVVDDERRFTTLKMQLDSAIYTQVAYIIRHPPATNKYNALKSAVIKVFTDSEIKKTQDLISGLALGDKKPSMLLAEMRELHRGPIDDRLFKELWLSRLPTQVKGILMGTTIQQHPFAAPMPLEKMAEAADLIMEYTNRDSSPASNIHAISTNPCNDVLKELLPIMKRIDGSLQQRNYRSKPENSNKSSQSGNNSPKTTNTETTAPEKPCIYHTKYGRGQHKNRKCHEKCILHKEWLETRQATEPKN